MRLEDCCINITDGEHGTVVDNINGSFFLLSNKNIVDSQIIITNEDRRIDHNTFIKINRRTKLEVGDVLISTVGTIGKTAVIEEDVNFVFQRSVGIIKPDQKILNPYYLKYLLDSEHYQTILTRSAKGAVQKCIFIGDLKDLYVNLPSIEEQERTISILRNLDRKISLNRSINAELERMAKEIYDYWFVQFEFPDANGRPYKSFGGAMVYNPVLKREVPEGWEVVKLIDIANITMGQSPDGSSYNEDGDGIIFYQGSTDFGMRFPDIRKYTTAPTRYASKGDILMSVRAPVGAVNIANNDCCIGRGLAALNSKIGSQSHLFYVIADLKTAFDQRNAAGTTFGSITKDDLYSLPVVKPSNDVISSFEKLCSPIFDRLMLLGEETVELTNKRDELLPLLMTGQVEVKE